MKKHGYIATFLFATLISCTTTKSGEAPGAPDSTAQVTGMPSTANNLATEKSTGVAPESNYPFPAYSLELISDDPLEANVSSGLQQLLDSCSGKNYDVLQASYTSERDYEGEYQPETEKITETKRWFFDSLCKVVLYEGVYERTGEGRDIKSIVYVLKDESVVGVIDEWKQEIQLGLYFYKRMLASSCPNCGTSIDMEAGASNPPVKKLSDTDLAVANVNFQSHLDNALAHIRDSRNSATNKPGDVFSIEMPVKEAARAGEKEVNYTLTYEMSKELFNALRIRDAGN